MSEIKKKKYKCTGCGEDRPCYLETNREPHTLDYMQVHDLKCMLDETNQTGCNWREVKCSDSTPVIIDCGTCKHTAISKYVNPCYGCRDNDGYDNWESNSVNET